MYKTQIKNMGSELFPGTILKCLIILLVFSGILQPASAQGTIVLEKKAPSSTTQVIATQQVILKAGFHAVGTVGSFNAKIGQTNSLFPANMVIAEGSTALTQNIFVPGIGQNYIKTITYLKDDESQSLISYQYFDGLGRPSQTANVRFTPSGADLVTLVEYDGAGRENIKWLPAVISGNAGDYVDPTAFKSAAIRSHASDSRSYMETLLEASPLNRITGQKKPGTDWENHPTSVSYEANSNDILHFTVTADKKLQKESSNYTAATLYKTVTTDEDSKSVTEYKDKLGRVVMKQSSTDVQTYYVYNDLDQLCYVLPPNFIVGMGTTTSFDDTNTLLKQYGYVYQYDERGNCIYKRLPGCDPIFIVYDKADRLILSQDGNQRAKSPAQWAVTKYDGLGRVVFTGLTTSITASQTDLITTYKSDLIVETISSGTYTNIKFTDATPLTVSYYDNYDFLPSGNKLIYDNTQEQNGYTPKWSNAKGLFTGTRTYILDGTGTNYLSTAMYYDAKGHVVQTRATNHLSGYDLVYNQYDFTGKVSKTYKTHGINGALDTYTELYTYNYDNGQRLETTTYSLNGATAVTLTSNTYDELGLLQTKTIGNGVDATTYSYNIQGHITEINGNKFSENLYYNANTANLPNFTPCYNGNIAGMKWNVTNESLGYQRAYSFDYDDLNRLTDAKYYGVSNSSILSGTSGRYNEHFEFDKMGNITNFVRYGLQANNTTMIYGKIDDLVLDHTGNQLTKVTDSGTNGVFCGNEEFLTNTLNTSNSCAYDANGNRLYDSNSNVWGIKYNVLNLPDAIQFYQGHQTNYTYNAAGAKLRVVDKTAPAGAELPVTSLNTILANPSVAMTTTTDYVGNIIYENGVLKRILTPEGYWQNGTYYYFLKDHLGSNRVVITGSGAVVESSSYYPSGMRYGESAIKLNNSVQPYRHTGHEMQEMHGLNWIDNNARFRTVSDGGGFAGLDPLCELKPWQSPYMYCSGNPLNRTDPTGMVDVGLPDQTIPEVAVTGHDGSKNNSNSSPSVNFIDIANRNTPQIPRITPSSTATLSPTQNNQQQNRTSTKSDKETQSEALKKVEKFLAAHGFVDGSVDVVEKIVNGVPTIVVLFKDGAALANFASVMKTFAGALGPIGFGLAESADILKTLNGDMNPTDLLGWTLVNYAAMKSPVVAGTYLFLMLCKPEPHSNPYSPEVCPVDNTFVKKRY